MQKIRLSVVKLSIEDANRLYERGYALEINDGVKGYIQKEIRFRIKLNTNA